MCRWLVKELKRILFQLRNELMIIVRHEFGREEEENHRPPSLSQSIQLSLRTPTLHLTLLSTPLDVRIPNISIFILFSLSVLLSSTWHSYVIPTQHFPLDFIQLRLRAATVSFHYLRCVFPSAFIENYF